MFVLKKFLFLNQDSIKKINVFGCVFKYTEALKLKSQI